MKWIKKKKMNSIKFRIYTFMCNFNHLKKILILSLPLIYMLSFYLPFIIDSDSIWEEERKVLSNHSHK